MSKEKWFIDMKNKTERAHAPSLNLQVQQIRSMYTVPPEGSVGTSGRRLRGGKLFSQPQFRDF